MTGEDVFRAANTRSAAPPFIFMTGYGQIDQAVALVRAGAIDYLTKPFDLPSLLQKAREIVAPRTRNSAEGLLGVSPSSIDRDVRFSLAWLHERLHPTN